jgi:hypothetical protein
MGGIGLPLALDVVDAASVERAAEEIETALGPIDVWGQQRDGIGVLVGIWRGPRTTRSRGTSRWSPAGRQPLAAGGRFHIS